MAQIKKSRFFDNFSFLWVKKKQKQVFLPQAYEICETFPGEIPISQSAKTGQMRQKGVARLVEFSQKTGKFIGK